MTLHKDLYRPSGFFLVRTPLVSIDALLAWGEALTAAAAPGAQTEAQKAALAHDAGLARARLKKYLATPAVAEALRLASPSLSETQAFWDKAPDSERGQKFEHAAARYFARLSGRCTPFGLFAGCTAGVVGEQSAFALEALGAYRRFSRLDVDYLETLVQSLRGGWGDASRVLRVNSSLYTTPLEHRYVETHVRGDARAHELVRVGRSPYLDLCVARAREGVTAAALAGALSAHDETLTGDEINEFIAELERAQVLISELEPLVTGGDALGELVRVVGGVSGCQDLAQALSEARAALVDIDLAPFGAGEAAAARLEQSLARAPVPPRRANLLHVELHKPGTAQLSARALDKLLGDVTRLMRAARPVELPPLTSFRDAFTARFESRLVPLALALDEESGVGFGNAGADQAEVAGAPLLAGLPFAGAATRRPGEPFLPYERLLQKLHATQERGAAELALEDADLELLEAPPAPPDAFAIGGTFLARSAEALDRGEFRFALDGFMAPGACSILGRFAAGNDALREQIASHMRAEQALRPEAIFAEIVHQPDGRMGNIIARPVLRAHEIPYLGRSGAARDCQIPLDDLLVTVRDGRVVLWSKRHDKEVVARLTTAHNTHLSTLGIYRFLAALQTQDGVSLGWSWGALETAPSLPRVVYRRLVLAWARWRLDKAELTRLRALPVAERFAATQAYRACMRLPRWVCLIHGDNHLPVDLDNPISVEAMFSAARSGDPAIFEEYGALEGADVVCGPEGRFVHELVIPFVRRAPTERARVVSQGESLRGASRERSFTPGSPWTYLKLYAGVHSIDALVATLVGDFAAMAREDDVRWFFIRYADPQHHLRLRFFCADEVRHAALQRRLLALARTYCGDYGVYRLQLDTYEREIERYGGPEGIDLAETFFAHDSAAAAAIVRVLREAGGGERWPYALLGMHRIIEAAGLSSEGRVRMLSAVRQSSLRRLTTGPAMVKAMAARFREHRARLDALLADGHNTLLADGLNALVPIYAALEDQQRQVFTELRKKEDAALLNKPALALVPSFLHMHANRMLRAAANHYEHVIYDFLGRIYESQAARGRE